jgi:hypothetical protein
MEPQRGLADVPVGVRTGGGITSVADADEQPQQDHERHHDRRRPPQPAGKPAPVLVALGCR